MFGPPPFSRNSLRHRLMALGGTAFLIYLVVILLFFPLLHFTLKDLMERTIRTIEEQKANEATTIARLLVLEFSHLSELLNVEPGGEQQIDQRVMRLLWEKVTFNEVIEGIELIHAVSDAEGRHLTYWYYRREEPELEPMPGPLRGLKKFTGSERQLLESINTQRIVREDLLGAVNRGPKQEGEMLLRYFPLYIPLPELGAIYWGVAKIGIDVDSMRRMLLFQSQEQSKIRNTVGLEIMLSLLISGLLAFGVVYFWTKKLTQPLNHLSRVAYTLETGQTTNLELWHDNVEQVDPQGQVEVNYLRRVLMRLAQTIAKVSQQLVGAEGQACQGRVAGKIIPTLKMQSRTCQELQGEVQESYQSLLNLLKVYESLPSLTAAQREEMRVVRKQLESPYKRFSPAKWTALATNLQTLDTYLQDLGHFLEPPEAVWDYINLIPNLNRALNLIAPTLAPEVKISKGFEILPAIWGCQRDLDQAWLYLLDYARQELAAGGELVIQTRQPASNQVEITLSFSGPPKSEAEIQTLLAPFQTSAAPPVHWGVTLAAAIFRQHHGDFSIKPRDAGGLSFTARLPIGALS